MDERKNKNIVGEERVLLHDQSLPLHLWAEACNKTVYLHNMSPHQILDMSIAKEYFLWKKPYVSHFKIFGSSVYCDVSKESRKKIDPMVKLGIFVGYTETPCNYPLYLLSLRMTIVCRDVKFDEENAMRCFLERELQLHSIEEIFTINEEPWEVVEQPQEEEQRVEASTQAGLLRDGRK